MSDPEYDLNVWPAFSDLLLSVVLVLILLVSMIFASQAIVDPKLPQRQETLINEIAGASSSVERLRGPFDTKLWLVRSNLKSKAEIECRIDPQNPFLQRLSFADNVLFESDRTDLKADGKVLLLRVGSAIKEQLAGLSEIQIHGHADPQKTKRFKDNLELASLRANEVYRFLQIHVGLNPNEAVMSSASFAEYMPTERVRERAFNEQKLSNANASESKRQQNRRIELLLFYKTRKP